MSGASFVVFLAMAVDACNFDATAQEVFGNTCAAMMISDSHLCQPAATMNTQGAYIPYFCATACGTTATMKATYPGAFTGVNMDALCGTVLSNANGCLLTAGPTFQPAYSYSGFRTAYGTDEDPDSVGIQHYFGCNDVNTIIGWYGTAQICTTLFSTICPEAFDTFCVAQHGIAASVKAEATECIYPPSLPPASPPASPPDLTPLIAGAVVGGVVGLCCLGCLLSFLFCNASLMAFLGTFTGNKPSPTTSSV